MKSIKTLVRPLVSAVFESLHDNLFAYMQRTGLVLNAAHTAAATFTDTTYAICATLPATYDASGYGASGLTYTLIGKVSDFPTYGSKRAVTKFMPISGGVEKVKGTPDYGDGDMIMADVPADAGQVILKAAEASQNHYSIKVTFADGEIHYLDVIVAGWALDPGKEGAVMTRTANLAICRSQIIVAAL